MKIVIFRDFWRKTFSSDFDPELTMVACHDSVDRMWHSVRRPASSSSLLSFLTKWGSRISRELFDLESSHLARTFTPVGSTVTPDMKSLYISGRNLSTFEKGQWRLRRRQPRINKIGTYIRTDILISRTGFDVSDYFQLAVIEVQKTCENAKFDGFADVYLVNRLS